MVFRKKSVYIVVVINGGFEAQFHNKRGQNIETPKLKLLYSCAIFFMTSIVLNIFRER